MTEVLETEIIEQNQETPEPIDLSEIDYFSLPKEQRLIVKQQVKESLDEIGKKAWEIGWRPEPLWGGKGKDGRELQYVGPEEYIKNYEASATIRNERMRKLSEKNGQLEEKLRFQGEKLKEMELRLENFNKMYTAQAEQDIENQLKKAEEDYDLEKVKELTARKVKMETVLPQMQSQQTLEPDPRLVEWHQHNKWYSNDKAMTAVANNFAAGIGKNIDILDAIDATDRYMRMMYPDKLKNIPTPSQIFSNNIEEFDDEEELPIINNKISRKMVESTTYGGFKSPIVNKKKGFNDLPQEAKEACKQSGISPESYAKIYWEDYEKLNKTNKK